MKQKKTNLKIVGEYELNLDKKLGEGMSCVVYEAYDTLRHEFVAIKMIQRGNNNSKPVDEISILNTFKREYSIVTKINSQNVLIFKDVIVTKRYFYIVEQKCDGDLRAFMNEHPLGVSEEEAINLVVQILKGVYALIVTNVIHRDIKPENILFKNGKLKIADFGLSRRVRPNQTLFSAVGTRIYSSPQIIMNSQYTTKCDIWSFGAIYYELLFGKKLFNRFGTNLLKTMKQLQQQFQFPQRPEVSQNSKELIRACLRFEQKDRAEWQFIFKHPLISGKVPSIDELNKFLSLILTKLYEEIYQKNTNLDDFFKKIDVSKNNEINYESFHKIIVKLIGVNKAKPDCQRFSFNYFDKNKNNKITFIEFQEVLKSNKPHQQKNQKQLLFRLHDSTTQTV